jgi:hypothetical protein
VCAQASKNDENLIEQSPALFPATMQRSVGVRYFWFPAFSRLRRVRTEIEDTIGLEEFHRIEEKTVENQK